MVCIPPTYCHSNAEYPFGDTHIHLLQPTLTKYPPKEKINNLIDNNTKWDGIGFLVQREPKYPYKLIFTPVSELKKK